jgi:hypothetical protein
LVLSSRGFDGVVDTVLYIVVRPRARFPKPFLSRGKIAAGTDNGIFGYDLSYAKNNEEGSPAMKMRGAVRMPFN